MQINKLIKFILASFFLCLAICAFFVIKMDVIQIPAYVIVFLFTPLIFITDICFLILPITIISLFTLSFITLKNKSWKKHYILYAVLSFLIILGITNMELDVLTGDLIYVFDRPKYATYVIVLAGIILSSGAFFIARKKNAKLFLLTYVVGLIAYLLYKIITVVCWR